MVFSILEDRWLQENYERISLLVQKSVIYKYDNYKIEEILITKREINRKDMREIENRKEKD